MTILPIAWDKETGVPTVWHSGRVFTRVPGSNKRVFVGTYTGSLVQVMCEAALNAAVAQMRAGLVQKMQVA